MTSHTHPSNVPPTTSDRKTLLRFPAAVDGGLAHGAPVTSPPLEKLWLDARALLEALPDGAAVFDNGICRYANPLLSRLIGASRAKLEGRAIEDLFTVTHAGLAASLSCALKRDDGSLQPVSVSVQPLSAADSDDALVLCVVRSARLDGDAAGLPPSFMTMMASMRSRVRFEFLNELLVHDVNNALQSVLGNISLELDTANQQGRGTARLERAESAASQARDYVRRHLQNIDVSRARPREVALEAIVANALAYLKTSAPGDLETRWERRGTSSSVMGDAASLIELVIELLANAKEATGASRSTVELSIRSAYLDSDVSLGRTRLTRGSYARIRVRDRGAGMDEATVRRAREPFFSTNPAGGHMGIGLAFAESVARRHGGGLVLMSGPDHGTVVEVFLPHFRRMR